VTKLEEFSRILDMREQIKEMWYFQLILSSIVTPRYFTWSFCSGEETVPSLFGKFMFLGVFNFAWAGLIHI